MEAGRDLLVEIGTEELPPKALEGLSGAFSDGLSTRLRETRIAFGEIESFATPRRLALLVHNVALRQPDEESVRRGPALGAAFDAAGQPTQAALGFARSCGVEVSELEAERTDKGAWLGFRQRQVGKATSEIIVDIIRQVLHRLPIPKRMRWGAGEEEFARPVHWVIVLFGRETLEGRLFGVECGAQTRGHRFHHPAPILVEDPADYAVLLRTRGCVEPSFSRRRELIVGQIQRLATEMGGRIDLNKDLLDEVTALCEWPTAFVASFEEGFLEIPQEVLIETMQKNQKYFPLFSDDGRLLPRFIAISNIESRDQRQVQAGNERVIRPRFSDAAFFWHQDLKQPLAAYASRLREVVFQEQLGTLAEKSSRVERLSRQIAGLIGVDKDLVGRAAQLAKCDLVTQMVFELPSLQGIMGRYYASHAGEDPRVASAMEEQYLPRHAGDRLPQSDCGRVLSVAERLDTLVGIFAIGQRPTGVRDPYALRRAAIGLLRILIETPLALDLRALLDFAAEGLKDKVDAEMAAEDVFTYVLERLKGYYEESNIRSDTVDAVLALQIPDPSDIHRRVLAVDKFRHLPEAAALTAANKRIRNILRQSEEAVRSAPSREVFTEGAEKRLADQISTVQQLILPMLRSQDYENSLRILAKLREDVDSFFEQVLVMAEDPLIRRNRLALVGSLQSLFLGVADISLLQ